MVAFLMLGVVAVIGFLCVVSAIPNLGNRR